MQKCRNVEYRDGSRSRLLLCWGGLMTPELLVFIVIWVALLVQGLVGFGSALISMPILAQALGVSTAAPLFALCVLIGEGIMIVRHRKAFRFASVWRLMIAAVIAIPIGIRAAHIVPQNITLFLLGVITFGFALYSLVGPQIPALKDKRWAFGFGFVAGLLSGAYNTGGPPYVIYGTTQRWSQSEFKANIQSVFLISSLTVCVSHFLNGNFKPEVLHLFTFALPAIPLGLGIGFILEPFISPVFFRKAVLVLLLILGLTLIF